MFGCGISKTQEIIDIKLVRDEPQNVRHEGLEMPFIIIIKAWRMDFLPVRICKSLSHAFVILMNNIFNPLNPIFCDSFFTNLASIPWDSKIPHQKIALRFYLIFISVFVFKF